MTPECVGRATPEPAEINGFTSALMAAFGSLEDAGMVIAASVYVDETGSGDEPRLLIGGVAANALRWSPFFGEWRAMLLKAGVPYAHFYEMDRNLGPFEDRKVWNVGKKAQFLSAQLPILNRACEVALTVSLDKQLYRDVYRKDFPTGASPDSIYGVASKELILQAARHCHAHLSADVVNFVWERGHPSQNNVQAIFEHLKDCYPDNRARFGAFIPLDRIEAPPLQAIDQLVVAARAAEPEAKRQKRFVEISGDASRAEAMMAMEPGETFPVFYHGLTAERLLWHRENKVEMTRLSRRARAERKRANRQGGGA